MKNYAIENEFLLHPQRMLIFSFKLEYGTVIVPLFNFHMEINFMELNLLEKYFNVFIHSVVDARREGDDNPLSGVLAETIKFFGFSSY